MSEISLLTAMEEAARIKADVPCGNVGKAIVKLYETVQWQTQYIHELEQILFGENVE